MQDKSPSPYGQLWVGTSGWVYKHWKRGVFYPPKLAPSEELNFYTEHFRTVEINFSFYRLPQRAVFEAWRRQTPAGFVFAVKGSRYLTHMKKLKDPEEPLARLIDRASGLGEKLGPILFQFPHMWSLHLERLEPFLNLLGRYRPQRFALEFRHSSWLVPEVYRLLEAAGAALCLPVHPLVPLDVRLSAPWTYIRMHGGQNSIGYSDEELGPWAERIAGYRKQGVDVYVYFNNDAEGWAVHDARRFMEMFGQ